MQFLLKINNENRCFFQIVKAFIKCPSPLEKIPGVGPGNFREKKRHNWCDTELYLGLFSQI